MGKKSGGGGSSAAPNYGPAPAVASGDVDIASLLAPLLSAMTSLSDMRVQTPTVLATPVAKQVEPVDWVAKQRELQANATKEVQDTLAKKKGRQSTILTSPLVGASKAATVTAQLRAK